MFSRTLISKSTFFAAWVCMCVNDYLLTWPSWTLIDWSLSVYHSKVSFVLHPTARVCCRTTPVSAAQLHQCLHIFWNRYEVCVCWRGRCCFFCPLSKVFSAELLLVTQYFYWHILREPHFGAHVNGFEQPHSAAAAIPHLKIRSLAYFFCLMCAVLSKNA